MAVQRGVATFTLDRGRCPRWLFKRMVNLGEHVTELLIIEHGPNEFIRRVADPVWFQSLGTVLAFDWNASGLTTILTAALREAIKDREEEVGIFICGGKGATSRKTPDHIRSWGSRLALGDEQTNQLVQNSRLSAKVDSSLVQDGFELYHHTLFFSEAGDWSVVQQGMNTERKRARRYHWYSPHVDDLVVEPHEGIISDPTANRPTLNLTDRESDDNRSLTVEMVNTNYRSVLKDLILLDKHVSRHSKMARVGDEQGNQLTLLDLSPDEFRSHPVLDETFSDSSYLKKILPKVIERKPSTYQDVVGMKGVGPKTMRALTLIGEVIYGAKPSYQDPARYSFAHGGKDGTPYPVDRSTYDRSIALIRKAIRRSGLSPKDKNKAEARLMDQRKKLLFSPSGDPETGHQQVE